MDGMEVKVEEGRKEGGEGVTVYNTAVVIVLI